MHASIITMISVNGNAIPIADTKNIGYGFYYRSKEKHIADFIDVYRKNNLEGLFDNGYVYIIDQYSGLIFGNGAEQDKNGQMISDFSDTLSAAIAQDIESDSFGTIRECAGVYYNLQKVSGTSICNRGCARRS